jgi:hypothetical protein
MQIGKVSLLEVHKDFSFILLTKFKVTNSVKRRSDLVQGLMKSAGRSKSSS